MSTERPLPDSDDPGESDDPRGLYYSVSSLVYDERGNVVDVVRQDGRAPARMANPDPLFHWEHLPEKRLFRLTAGGKAEYWRDNPTRYLAVELDAESGMTKPSVKRGHLVYLLLCREEHEAL